jgi:hypothetical protein
MDYFSAKIRAYDAISSEKVPADHTKTKTMLQVEGVNDCDHDIIIDQDLFAKLSAPHMTPSEIDSYCRDDADASPNGSRGKLMCRVIYLVYIVSTYG